METSKKIKIVMVCNMSNPMVRSHLPLDDGRIFNNLRKILGMAPKEVGFHDYAPWNSHIADDFGGRDDVSLTIVAVHLNMKKLKATFVDNNVKYVFLNFQWANLIKRFFKNIEKWARFNPFAKVVKREIRRINPDMVLLMGLENAYYSGTLLGLKNYPIYGLCQTVYNNPIRQSYMEVNKDNSITEMQLFKELQYIGVFCKMHYELVRQYSPHSYVFKFGGFPTSDKLLEPSAIDKEYDFVNFAMVMCKDKGYHDTIQALAIVKRRFPKVKLNLTGSCPEKTKEELKSLIEKYGLEENIIFTPLFERQHDMFLHVQKSRFALLPCKLDNTSGTMMQAMQLGLPLVCYKTSGTPAFNKEKQCALIAEKDNIEDLAAKMLMVMDNPKLAEELKANAREWQEKKHEYDSHNGDRLVANFNAIIDNFRNGTPIPQQQLFNPNIDD